MGATGRPPGKMNTMVDTEIADGTEQPALPNPAAVEYHPWPNWKRRTLIAVVMLVAIGSAAWLIGSTESNPNNDLDKSVVISLTPNEGGQAPIQTEVGAGLAVGYDGRLTINGIEIPEDQMVGARDPSKVTPEDLRKNGLRPNNRNQVFFKPGPGKVIEKFEPGTIDVTLRYFKDGQPSEGVGTVSWSFKVI
ncbi:MAG: hypothetical protein ACTHN0_00245 [Aquihabitans sp.]